MIGREFDRFQYKGHQYRGGGWSRYFLWSKRLKGFGVQIYPSNEKRYIVQFRESTKRRKQRVIILGRVNEISFPEACMRARAFLKVLRG